MPALLPKAALPMDSWFFLLFPAGYICGVAGPEEAKNVAGQKFSAVIRIRIATPSLRNLRQLFKIIRRKCESPIQVPRTQSVFLRRGRSNAFRSHGRQRSKLFALQHRELRPNP